MPQPIYAAAADVQTEANAMEITLPPGFERWLPYASRLVTDATMLETYPVNADGTPADTDLAALFRDATVAQILFWASNGVNPLLGAGSVKGTGEVVSSSIGGGSITKANANTEVVRARMDSLYALVPSAAALLNGSGRVTVLW